MLRFLLLRPVAKISSECGLLPHAKYLLPAASNSTLEVFYQMLYVGEFARVYDCIVLDLAGQSSPSRMTFV